MHRLLTGPLSVEHLTIPIANLPVHLQGTKIVQLSDLHYDGVRLSEQMLADAIAASNRVQPDLVVLTGDYITYEPEPIYPLVQRLKHLQSRYGIYAVLGNHDLYYPNARNLVTQALTGIGVRVLWNEVAYPLGSELALVGLPDFWSKQFNPASVLDELEPQLPRIVLSHQPDSAQILQQWRVDLQLSGHTHGGQIILPFLGPLPAWQNTVRRLIPKPLRPWIPYMEDRCNHVVRHWEWSRGLHRIGQNLLYTNPGLGTYYPGRLCCPPEVTVFTLKEC
ncbi:MAG: metallophosphoesterase [Desertifilum sp.]|nr:metallophosphoesterase [Desertifilum sp.]